MSNRHDVDMQSGRNRQGFQIAGIGGKDEVTVNREENKRCIDDIIHPSLAQQVTCAFAEPGIEGNNVESRHQPGKNGLPTGATAPHLTDHAAMRQRNASFQQLLLEQGQCVSVASFNGNQRAGIEHKSHRLLRPDAGRAPRTVTALARARRVA